MAFYVADLGVMHKTFFDQNRNHPGQKKVKTYGKFIFRGLVCNPMGYAKRGGGGACTRLYSNSARNITVG